MELMERLAEAERRIGYRFKDRELLARSLRHASSADDRLDSNERLEFLGDAILGMVVCTELFDRYPTLFEGELTKIKSNVVSRRVCAEIAEELELGQFLQLGKGMNGRGDMPSSLHAAVLESIIGAMYLDGGFGLARQFILDLLNPRIEHAAKLGHQHNFKSVLQQVFQRKGLGAPSYKVLDERGPDHAKCFEVCVAAGSRQFEGCWGPNKKQAEQQAALSALLHLDLAVTDGEGDIRLAEACWNDDPVEEHVAASPPVADPDETGVDDKANGSTAPEDVHPLDDAGDASADVETLVE
jgi:ribonuclease-3